jgi:hypothetical protein
MLEQVASREAEAHSICPPVYILVSANLGPRTDEWDRCVLRASSVHDLSPTANWTIVHWPKKWIARRLHNRKNTHPLRALHQSWRVKGALVRQAAFGLIFQPL